MSSELLTQTLRQGADRVVDVWRGEMRWQEKYVAISAGFENATARASRLYHLSFSSESWRRLDGNAQLPKLILSVKFADELEVVAKMIDRQPATTAS